MRYVFIFIIYLLCFTITLKQIKKENVGSLEDVFYGVILIHFFVAILAMIIFIIARYW